MNNKELLKKWEELLDYDSKGCPKLNDPKKRLKCAKAMESIEEQHYPNNYEFCKNIIPHIRRNEGEVKTKEFDGVLYYEWVWVDAFDKTTSEQYLINANTEMNKICAAAGIYFVPCKNYYILDDGEWVWEG